MNELVQLDRHLDVGKRLAVIVEQFEIGNETERVGHRNDACLHFDPVPGHTGRLPRDRVAPKSLAGAGRLVVAKTQHTCAQMRQVELWRTTGLPQ